MVGGGINGLIQSGGKASGFARGLAAGLVPQDLGVFGKISGKGASEFLAGLGSVANDITRDGLRGYIVGGRDGIIRGIAIGQLNNAVGHIVGFVGSGGNSPKYKNGGFIYKMNMGTGITFGNVMTISNNSYAGHEYGHMSQSEWLGASYSAVHALALTVGAIFGNTHGSMNPLDAPGVNQSAPLYTPSNDGYDF